MSQQDPSEDGLAVRTDHLGGPSSEDVMRRDLEALVAWARPKELRAAVFIRDPLEVILSGYFYHRTTTEVWATVGMATRENMSVYEKACDDRFDGDVASMAACTLLEYRERNATYQELLEAVDPSIGLMIEALRSWGEIDVMNTTVSALDAVRDVSRVYDLAAVTANSSTFDAAFGDIFEFLGATDVDDCVLLAARHDLHRGEAFDHHGRHVMATTLLSQRDALRVLLLMTPWFDRTIQPYRRSLGYFDD